MAHFLPSYEQATFVSRGEHRLHQLLASLDDEYTVIHSCPWLRAISKRVFSKEDHRYIELFRNNRTHVSGEIDFIIAHPRYGLLCIEVKSGEYLPLGARFVHAADGHIINPLEQVRDNAFTTIKLNQSNKISCPVGYAVYMDASSLDPATMHPAFKPVGAVNLPDGIMILPQHEHRLADRIEELFEFWRATSDFAGKGDFKELVDRFIESVWPKEALDKKLGRKIAFDNHVWLKLDERQHAIVKSCVARNIALVAGFAGTGKTVIACAAAISHAQAGRRVIFLLKNKKIAQHLTDLLARHPDGDRIVVSTFHAYCDRVGNTDETFESVEYSTHYRYLLSRPNQEFDCLVMDEAQSLSEDEHRALEMHFRDARKYIFADHHQIFRAFEKGVEYKFLEKTYGTDFFFLSAVYRNPPRITDEIRKIVPSNNEPVNLRTETGDSLTQSFVRNVELSTRKHVERLLSQGAKEDDIVILTEFSPSFSVGAVPMMTIASFRGMEAPIVIVLPIPKTDDNTLACALGRCTTQAIVLLQIEDFLIDPVDIASVYLRERARLMRLTLENRDRADAAPLLVKSIVERFAGTTHHHTFGGLDFAFSPVWRCWIAEGAKWPNSVAHLWSVFLCLLTGADIYGVDVNNNRFGQALKVQQCGTCKTVTPHRAPRMKCIACAANAPDAASFDLIMPVLSGANPVLAAPLQSVVNVSRKITNPEGKYDLPGVVSSPAADVDLMLASVLMLIQAETKTGVFGRDEIETWLAAALVPADFDSSIGKIASRVITSLCNRTKRDVMERVGQGRYRFL